jgi:hypothetical protein
MAHLNFIWDMKMNNPNLHSLELELDRWFHDANALLALVEALRINTRVRNICFNFDQVTDHPFPMNHWDSLLREIESRAILEEVKIKGYPPSAENSNLMPLYRDQLFPALQRNHNIESCKFENVDLSLEEDEIATYIEGATYLQDLVFRNCSCDSHEAGRLATALQRTTNIVTLELRGCEGNLFVCPLLQGLASPDSRSTLQKLIQVFMRSNHLLRTFWANICRVPVRRFDTSSCHA